MERTQRIIVVLLIAALVFSLITTLFSLSIINFEFKPININVPGQVGQGNPDGQIKLIVEANPQSRVKK